MLDTTELDLENVWEIVKKARLSYLSQLLDSNCDKALLHESIIQENINNIAEELNLNTTCTPNKSVSDKTLKDAVEMYTYLNFCPSSFKKILSFSKYLFTENMLFSPKQIIFAMTNVIKNSQNAAKVGMVELFSKVMNIFSLFHYEDIQIITKGKCYTKGTFGTCTKNINVTKKEELEFLGFLY